MGQTEYKQPFPYGVTFVFVFRVFERNKNKKFKEKKPLHRYRFIRILPNSNDIVGTVSSMEN